MSKENRVSDERLTLIASGIADRLGAGASAAPDLERDIASAITELLSLRSKPVAGVEVKPLEWSKTSYGRPEVETVVGFYRVFEHVDGGWAATFKTFNLVDAHGRKNFATEQEALAAAEADYRQRILSNLSYSEQEPVGWQPRRKQAVRIAMPKASEFVFALHPTERDALRDADECRPLYVSPQPEAVITEARILYRHQKRGTVYELIGIGKMQAEAWRDPSLKNGTVYGPSVDMREVAVYRSADNPDEIWVRPREEFQDGRFDKVDSSNG